MRLQKSTSQSKRQDGGDAQQRVNAEDKQQTGSVADEMQRDLVKSRKQNPITDGKLRNPTATRQDGIFRDELVTVDPEYINIKNYIRYTSRQQIEPHLVYKHLRRPLSYKIYCVEVQASEDEAKFRVASREEAMRILLSDGEMQTDAREMVSTEMQFGETVEFDEVCAQTEPLLEVRPVIIQTDPPKPYFIAQTQTEYKTSCGFTQTLNEANAQTENVESHLVQCGEASVGTGASELSYAATHPVQYSDCDIQTAAPVQQAAVRIVEQVEENNFIDYSTDEEDVVEASGLAYHSQFFNSFKDVSISELRARKNSFLQNRTQNHTMRYDDELEDCEQHTYCVCPAQASFEITDPQPVLPSPDLSVSSIYREKMLRVRGTPSGRPLQ